MLKPQKIILNGCVRTALFKCEKNERATKKKSGRRKMFHTYYRDKLHARMKFVSKPFFFLVFSITELLLMIENRVESLFFFSWLKLFF